MSGLSMTPVVSLLPHSMVLRKCLPLHRGQCPSLAMPIIPPIHRIPLSSGCCSGPSLLQLRVPSTAPDWSPSGPQRALGRSYVLACPFQPPSPISVVQLTIWPVCLQASGATDSTISSVLLLSCSYFLSRLPYYNIIRTPLLLHMQKSRRQSALRLPSHSLG